MKCANCSEEAIIRVNWKDKNYCKNHFRRYFLANVGKVLDKYKVEGKITVAVSGGKDSSACVEALTHFDRLKVSLFYIDLGIEQFSEKSQASAICLSRELGLNLKIIDLKEEYGLSVPEVEERSKGKICGLCGMIKRYVMNRYVFENSFDYLATGHNLSDQTSAVFNSLANVYLTPFRGLKPVLPKYEDKRLSARVKPLYFLKDDECLKYVASNDIPFTDHECQFSTNSPTNELKRWLHKLDSGQPRILRNFAKSFIRIEEKMHEDQGELGTCENCGYPTAMKICRFCRVMEKVS